MDFGLPHLVSIGGYLQAHVDVRVELLDLNYEAGDQGHLQRTLEELGPFLMIGLSCFSSFDYMRVMTLARFLRTLYPDVPLVTGGYHASALPHDVVFDGSPFDAVVVGEGELPMLEMVQTLMGGGRLDKQIYGPNNIQDLDDLPPYKWELLHRYWPKARDIGRKFQIFLSRGCPYKCTFCMERAKTEYKWRAYSAERAIDELKRLSRVTPLENWVVNLADPLFGFRRRWRRQVLRGIIDNKLFPRQYWTLTRSDDLDEEDVSLLAKARFSIGIGLESGSPDMLMAMNKGNTPDKYLGAMMRLARLSRDHGLNWASNIIVGHPGETMQSMRETKSYLTELFTSAKETCGWLSIDPFRLYPGSYVHETMDQYNARYGTQFYHREWWKSWYDGSFRAEHLDPSQEVDFEARVNFMYEAYAPLLQQIAQRFRGQGRNIDRVFKRSLNEQHRMMSDDVRKRILQHGRRAKREQAETIQAPTAPTALSFPIGLQIKDPMTRLREEAVRRLLERGVLRTENLITALLQIAPEYYMQEQSARELLGQIAARTAHTEPILSLQSLAMALEALEPADGDRIANLSHHTAYTAAVLAELVGPEGAVISTAAVGWGEARRIRKSWTQYPQTTLKRGDPTVGNTDDDSVDRMLIGGCLPRLPKSLRMQLDDKEGRVVAFLGPRFRAQDLVRIVRRQEEFEEQLIARAQVPILFGKNGWLQESTPTESSKSLYRSR